MINLRSLKFWENPLKNDLKLKIYKAYAVAAKSAKMDIDSIRTTRGKMRELLTDKDLEKDKRECIAEIVYDLGDQYDSPLEIIDRVKAYLRRM